MRQKQLLQNALFYALDFAERSRVQFTGIKINAYLTRCSNKIRTEIYAGECKKIFGEYYIKISAAAYDWYFTYFGRWINGDKGFNSFRTYFNPLNPGEIWLHID